MPMFRRETEACHARPENCPFVGAIGRRVFQRNIRRGIFAAVLVGLTWGGFLAGTIWTIFFHTNPPITYLSTELLSDTIRVGEPLTFVVHARPAVDRACIGNITREFYTAYDLDGKIVRRKKRDGGPVPILHDGETQYLVDIELLPNMAPGKWEFQGETTYDCGTVWSLIHEFPRSLQTGGVIKLRTPAMPFTLLDRK